MKKKTPKTPKVLIWDLETNGLNGLYADLGFVVCFGYKWLGEKKTYSLTFDKFGGYKKNGYSDKKLLRAASKLFAKADLLVAHFGDYFDRKFVNGRLVINGLPPLPPVKQRDTCKIAWKNFKFQNNRLKMLAKNLGCKQQKGENEFPGWWHGVLAGDKSALRLMAEYNKQDVRTLEEVYLKLRPFDNESVRLFADRDKCRDCGGRVYYRGYERTRERTYRRYQCRDCFKWGRDNGYKSRRPA